MIKVFRNLFIPHEHNNHRPKLLHLPFLYIFIILVIFFQFGLTYVQRQYPGVLGFAANISPEEVISQTNQKRQSSGLALLSANPTLSNAAMQKGAHMFAHNYWAHFAPDGTSPWYFFKNSGYSYLYAGENLARDFQQSGEVVSAWMNSPTHRDNIMSSNYSEIGVAVINGVLDGQETTLVVQFFGKPSQAYVGQQQPVQAVAAESTSKENEVPEPEIYVAEMQPEKMVESKPELEIEVVDKQEQLPTITPIPTIMIADTVVVATPDNKDFVAKQGLISGLSSFDLSKIFSIVLLGLLVLVLIVDSILIVKHKVVRIGGKNLVHLSFLVIVLIIVLLSSAGRIL